MAVMTAIGLGLGAASMGFGLYNQMEGREQAEQGYALQQHGAQVQAQGARELHQVSLEQAEASKAYAQRELGLNRLAADQSVFASNASKTINQQIVGFERQIEGQRRQAMEIDARRRQTEVMRNQQRARAVALTNATAQGANRGSGLQGGYGQIAGQSGVNMLGIQQNLQIGRNIFDLNSNITDQKLAFSDLQNMYAVQQANNQTTKSQMMYDYAVANANFTTRQSDINTRYMSAGQGIINQGQGLVGMGQSQSSMGNTFMQMGPQLFSMGMTAGNVFGGMGSGTGGLQTYGQFVSGIGSNGIY